MHRMSPSTNYNIFSTTLIQKNTMKFSCPWRRELFQWNSFLFQCGHNFSRHSSFTETTHGAHVLLETSKFQLMDRSVQPCDIFPSVVVEDERLLLLLQLPPSSSFSLLLSSSLLLLLSSSSSLLSSSSKVVVVVVVVDFPPAHSLIISLRNGRDVNKIILVVIIIIVIIIIIIIFITNTSTIQKTNKNYNL